MDPAFIEDEVSLNIDDVLEVLSLPLLGIVYEDESIIRANNTGTPLIINEKNYINKCYFFS